MIRKPIFARLAAASALAWPMAAWANAQLDQLEALLAKQREQQAQLGQLLKQTQAEVGRGPSWSMPGLPELSMQSALLSAGAVATVLICGAMLWLWKNRMPSSVAYRPTPEPYFKESGYIDSDLANLDAKDATGNVKEFKTSAFKASGYKDSAFKTPLAAGFSLPAQDSSWTESWATVTMPQTMPSANPFEVPYTPGAQPDISLDELESGFGVPVMDFDLSDFDDISSPDVVLADIVLPAKPKLAPLTVADFELAPVEPDSEDFSDSGAVFIAGEVDHRESAFDLLKFDPKTSAAQPATPAVSVATVPKPRALTKIDSEMPSRFDPLATQPLRPAVAYVVPVVNHVPTVGLSDSGFTGSAFGQLQPNVPSGILPYPHAISDDDAPYATQLQLAREFAEMGQVDEAELLCQEVFTNGTEPMREYALYILTRLPEYKRK